MTTATPTLARSVPHAEAKPELPRRWWHTASDVVVVLALVLAAFLVVSSATGALRIDTELSGSMRPKISPGAAIFVRPEPAAAVRLGQIIAFTPPKPYPQVTTIHQVVAVRHLLAHTVVRTKGTANQVPDPWTVVLPHVVWHEVAVVPLLGTVVAALRTGVVQAVILLVVAGALAWLAIGALRRRGQ